MIAVVTILDQQLPVGAGTISLLSRDDLHPHFRLIGYQVEILARAGQIVVEAFSRGIEEANTNPR